MNFWQDLPKPIFALAPMADVTDAAFRRIISKYSAHKRKDGTFGGPDIMWTEFVAADGLVSATPEGKEKLMANLIYSKEEKPIIAQLFTSNEEHMEYAAKLCLELGFDGVDINMGCPDRSIEKQGCGSAMIRNPENAKKIIKAAKRGARFGENEGIPVSVKTRLGYNEDQLEEWLPAILEESPAAITLHARTRKEMSRVPARWERIKRAVEIRDSFSSKTVIIGNGDVGSLEEAKNKINITGADGVMFGRAIFGNPWLFNGDHNHNQITLEERLRVMVEHSKLFEVLLPSKNFSIMKKHYKAYVNSFPKASELRAELMDRNNALEVELVINKYLKNNK